MLADASGRTIQFADVSPDQFRESLAGRVPDWQVDGLIEDTPTTRRGSRCSER